MVSVLVGLLFYQPTSLGKMQGFCYKAVTKKDCVLVSLPQGLAVHLVDLCGFI
jgi:hypothetical protein